MFHGVNVLFLRVVVWTLSTVNGFVLGTRTRGTKTGLYPFTFPNFSFFDVTNLGSRRKLLP